MSKATKVLSTSALLCTLLATATVNSLTASATQISEDKPSLTQLKNDNETINLLEDNPTPEIEIKDISREEYVQNVAATEGISFEEADLLVTERTNQSLNSIKPSSGVQAQASGSIVWRQASWTQSYPNNLSYKARMDASFEIYSDGSFRQINSCTVCSDLAAGTYKPSWSQSNSWKTTKFPVLTATVGVTGSFKSVYTGSAGISGGIPGFTVNASGSSSLTYVSKPMTIQKEYSVY